MSKHDKSSFGDGFALDLGNIPPEIAKLISGYLDGEITDSEFATLSQWIAADESHARQFACSAIVHSELRSVLQSADLRLFFAATDTTDAQEMLADPINIRTMLDEVAATEQREAQEAARQAAAEADALRRRRREAERQAARRVRRPEPIEIPVSVAVLAVAALAASLVLAVRSFLPSGNETVAQQPQAPAETAPAEVSPPQIVATISDSLQASWQDSSLSTLASTPLTAGPLTLETGVVELALADGVRIVGEAPLDIELVSSNRVLINRGKIVAKVPQEAIGFTVVANSAAIVDLGTEFGIDVAPAGNLSVHVLDGEVALVPDGIDDSGPRTTLLAGSARAVSADGSTIKALPFDEHAFLRAVPASPYELAVLKNKPLVFLRFDDRIDREPLTSLGRLPLAAHRGGGVTLRPESFRPEPSNGAAHFSGPHDGVTIERHDLLNLTSNFTIEAWVRTPPAFGPGSPQQSPQRIVSCFSGKQGSREDSRRGFGLGVAASSFVAPQRMPPMILLFTCYGVYDCVAQVGLTPNKWTHMAVTVDATGLPTLYVDGHQAPALFRADSRFQLATTQGYSRVPTSWNPRLVGRQTDKPLTLGRNPGAANASYPPERWQGALDELAIYNTKLDPEEIRKHYESGLVRTAK